MTRSLHVECRRLGSGLVPVRFGRRGRKHEVAEVLDRWPGEDHEYVKLRTSEGDTYILRYDSAVDAWEVFVFKAEDDASPSPFPIGVESTRGSAQR